MTQQQPLGNRGPAWYKGGRNPPDPPPPPPDKILTSVAAFCSDLCSLHCKDRSQILKRVSPHDALSDSVRYE